MKELEKITKKKIKQFMLENIKGLEIDKYLDSRIEGLSKSIVYSNKKHLNKYFENKIEQRQKDIDLDMY